VGVNDVDGDVQMFMDVRNTQCGRAIVQTEATRAAQGTPSVAAGQQMVNHTRQPGLEGQHGIASDTESENARPAFQQHGET
jgi:hypothetical protein